MSRITFPRPVIIVYRRLPNDVREFPGLLRQATSNRLVIECPIVISEPRTVTGKTVADNGYLAIWFIYKQRWYDIGKFYDRTRKWVGYYCDILKPVSRLMRGQCRTTTLTDLFLDLWMFPNGKYSILDENELADALAKNLISRTLAQQARRQMSSLIGLVQTGRFPPSSIKKIEPLERMTD
jgi:predicted RNA-binding protein associated with RNAse of E/G family